MFRELAVAFGFLTRLPVPDVSGGGTTPVTDDDLRNATTWFPLVGQAVGAWGGLVLLGTWSLLGPAVAATLAVAVTVMATGAFHEDGWADTFDGLWGGWTPERRIEIMRDSRIGTYGASALLLAFVLQIAVLSGMDDGWQAASVLVGAHGLARFSILLQIRRSEAATDQGNGARVADPVTWPRLVLALALTIVPGGLWLVLDLGHSTAAWLVLLAPLPAVEVVARISKRKVGGVTGDQLGATAMASLLAVLVAAAAVAD